MLYCGGIRASIRAEELGRWALLGLSALPMPRKFTFLTFLTMSVCATVGNCIARPWIVAASGLAIHFWMGNRQSAWCYAHVRRGHGNMSENMPTASVRIARNTRDIT